MPLYEYKCNSCDLKFDSFKSIQEYDQPSNCPMCNKVATKLVSLCSFVNEKSEHRDIDCIVGADAERKWERVYERKAKRDKIRAKKAKEKE